jgi:hypothetical protein
MGVVSEVQSQLIAALPSDDEVRRGLSEEEGGEALYVFNRWREAGFDEERSFLAAIRHLGAMLPRAALSGAGTPVPTDTDWEDDVRQRVAAAALVQPSTVSLWTHEAVALLAAIDTLSAELTAIRKASQ